ncbi:DUF4914 domain-containing protein [Vallitalea longa]|uniref:DUF4914 domain-containing protein n=2 Tax=Vallitalea longa TaxID=2936439 RepID=A0A9W5Y9N5_9FIRM|nr:DUF4914 domain-containing protein [Vallitalea longa]
MLDIMSSFDVTRFKVNEDVRSILNSASKVIVPRNREHLLDLATGGGQSVFKVNYFIDGIGLTQEATVTKCKNGLSVNYHEEYMRRRDPDCMVIGDNKNTDKTRYKERFNEDFDGVRLETYVWLKNQELIVMPLIAGDDEYGSPTLLICPVNAAFFAGGLADLQGFIPEEKIDQKFEPKAIIYLAPPFRHTHFDGKQVVVHNRLDDIHEIFSFNLYPGPSAKKGIYGVLLNIGELESWTTVHASTVKVTTPYDNSLIIMHEGASGGGKSEMIEEVHREVDGSILFGENTVTNERIYLEIADTCELNPVTDDMAMCHPELQNNNKLVVKDAEAGWFLRFNHITEYGTSPQHEKLCIHPKEPLIFLNMDASPDSTILIWDHIQDAPGKPCPNPRVIMPRSFVPEVVSEPVEIDVRSFGVRTPACTKSDPTYGIIGCLHILPPALAWIWRLVAPRGHANPSITDSEGMTSEGVGSYWPFATGKMVDQANLLLEQIINTPSTRYVLIPNQHIGSYEVGFNAQWIAREYLARKGSAKFKPEQIVESRCSLLGYSLNRLRVDGYNIPKGILQTNYQLSVGEEAYDQGAKILKHFFERELAKFNTDELLPLGREIINCFMNDGTVDDYIKLISMK